MNETPRETPRPVPKARPDGHAADFTTDQSIENAALAGAAAIQRIVAERNALRNRLAAQERELVGLRAFNDDLRRRLVLIHQHYVELAKRVVGQLEQFDVTMREVVQEAHSGVVQREAAPEAYNGAAQREESPSASLVQRLAESSAPAAPVAGANGADPAGA